MHAQYEVVAIQGCSGLSREEHSRVYCFNMRHMTAYLAISTSTITRRPNVCTSIADSWIE
jgi:hypothetical protein